MSIMNSYAIEVSTADTVNNPVVPTATAMPTATDTSLDAIMASIVIEFDSVDECEAVVAVRDGVEHRYCKQQRDVELSYANPRGGWFGFRCKATIVYFVRDGVCVGQTAVLPQISRQNEADCLTGRGLVEVCNDRVKFF